MKYPYKVHFYVIEQWPYRVVACFLTGEDAEDFVFDNANLSTPAVVVRVANPIAKWVDDIAPCYICKVEFRESQLTTEGERGMQFDEPVCQKCADRELRLSQMDDADIAYERARTNTDWED